MLGLHKEWVFCVKNLELLTSNSSLNNTQHVRNGKWLKNLQTLWKKPLVKRDNWFSALKTVLYLVLCVLQAVFDTPDLLTPQHLSSHPSKWEFKPNNFCSVVVPSFVAYLEAYMINVILGGNYDKCVYLKATVRISWHAAGPCMFYCFQM